MSEAEKITMAKDLVDKMISFLKGVDGVNIIPCDDLFDAVKGYLVYYDKDGEEKSVWIRWQFAKPVSDADRKPILNKSITCKLLGPRVYDSIQECITQHGWIQCDNPKKRLVGFVKYAKLDSTDDTKALMLGISGYKMLDDELRGRVEECREREKADFEEWREGKSKIDFVIDKSVSL